MLKIFAVVALAATTFAVTVNSHARANKHPEYHRLWEDGAVNKKKKEGFKANTHRPPSGLPTGKRQYKPMTVKKPIDK